MENTVLALLFLLFLIITIISLFFFFPLKQKQLEQHKPQQKQQQAKRKKDKAKSKNPYSHHLFHQLHKGGEFDITAMTASSGFVIVGNKESIVIYKDIVANKPSRIHAELPSTEFGSVTALGVKGDLIVVALADTFKIYVYQIKGEKVTLIGEAAEVHKKDIRSVVVMSKFFVTCSDTEFKVWGLPLRPAAGDLKISPLLATVKTNQLTNFMVDVSADSKFIAVAAFTSDVRLWEVEYKKKSGEFNEVKKAIELKGHKSGVNCVSFSKDSTQLATASKDGSWRLWGINVRYAIEEDPVLILSIQTPYPKVDFIAINPTKALVATASDLNLQFWDLKNGELIETIPDAFPTGATLLNIAWTPNGGHLVTAIKSTLVVWKSPK